MRDNGKFRNADYGYKVRKGYISILTTFVVLAIFITIQVIISESMDTKLRLTGYRYKLVFDYRVEAYYLMIKAGSLAVPEGEAFGSTYSYSLEYSKEGDTYISILTSEGVTTITGYLDGAMRGVYEIRD